MTLLKTATRTCYYNIFVYNCVSFQRSFLFLLMYVICVRNAVFNLDITCKTGC